LALAWAYLAPLLSAGYSSTFFEPLTDPNICTPLLRSLVLAGCASILSVILGFVLAVMLRNVEVSWNTGIALSLLLLPVLCGDLVVGFGFKALSMTGPWFNAAFSSRRPWAVLAVVCAMHTWQYGLLCAYVCWLRIARLDRSSLDFARTAGLSSLEVVRDIVAPRCRSLAVLLLLICFFIGTRETAKSWLVFKVSPGTHTSLIGHALWDQYQQQLPVSPQFAQISSLRTCAFVSASVIVASLALLLACKLAASLFVVVLRLVPSRPRPLHRLGAAIHVRWQGWVWIVSCIALGPLLAPLVFVRPSTSIDWAAFAAALGFAGAGACFSVMVALFFGFTLRLSAYKATATLGRELLCILMLLTGLLAIPSLAFVLCGYGVYAICAHSYVVLLGTWFAGQALLALPLLGSLALWLHTEVASGELEFQDGARLSLQEIARHSFLSRMRLEYSFALLFAWSLVWNESTLNRVVSDSLPTFIDLMSRTLSARPDFGRATTMCVATAIVAAAATALWVAVQRRALQSRNSQ
jgi:ABC-type spermidine/putrescine transport system permease subunit II